MCYSLTISSLNAELTTHTFTNKGYFINITSSHLVNIGFLNKKCPFLRMVSCVRFTFGSATVLGSGDNTSSFFPGFSAPGRVTLG